VRFRLHAEYMKNTGRNDACPCGSGKKYKQCCLQVTKLSVIDNSSLILDEAIAHHQAVRLPLAESLYRKILKTHPEHPQALHYLGIIALQSGNNELAVQLIGKSIAVNPADPASYINRGNALKNLGKFDAAIDSYQQALTCQPDSVEAHFNLAVTLTAAGRLDAAVMHYEHVLLFNPAYAAAHYNLGNLLKEQGLLNRAVAHYRQALMLKPNYPDVDFHLALIYQMLNNPLDATRHYRQAIALRADHAEAHNNLALLLQAAGEFQNAFAHYQQAILHRPDFAGAHINLAAAYFTQGQLKEAIEHCRCALALDPEQVEAYNNLAVALKDQGQQQQAIAALQMSLQLKADFAEARWKLAMAQIPLHLDDARETGRAKLTAALELLDGWFDDERIALGEPCVGTDQLFYLAYQEFSNREILARYGRLCNRLMKHWQEKQAFSLPRQARQGLIRVGVVSAHIRTHSVWDALVKGWFEHLDTERIELHVFHTGNQQDQQTVWAKTRAASFAQGLTTLKQWCDAILEKQLDVLIYPEIGMDMMTVKLASLRLAPLQLASWGHPETSGLPSIDYYLSAEYLEPADASAHYTEKLLCLPHLGCHYNPEMVISIAPDLAGLGIASGVPLLLCPGVPFKYTPQHDAVFVEIAAKLGSCQFVFFIHRSGDLSDKLRQRLTVVFAAGGLDFNDYCVFIPWLDKAAFYGLMKHASVFLDTIDFSGFNTAMQAISCALPVVTREGQFMRGRLAAGILRRMGITELIADSQNAYVELVVRLAQDAQYRQQLVQCIESSRDVLYNDVAPVQALQSFLIEASLKQRLISTVTE